MFVSDILHKLKNMIGAPKESRPSEPVFVRRPLVDTEGKAAADPQYKDRCVLVGVLRNPRQLEIQLRRNFYHIPISETADCFFPVKYIALYQSKRFFGKNAGIRYYGEVESYTTLKRCKIREIPKKSSEKYLYFKVKNWRVLNSPIEAKTMESAAFSTTYYLLNVCRDSSELQLRSKEEHIFYKNLVDKVKELVKRRMPDGGRFVYRDFVIELSGGMLYLYFGDIPEYAIGYDVFLDDPIGVVRDVFDYYPEI